MPRRLLTLTVVVALSALASVAWAAVCTGPGCDPKTTGADTTPASDGPHCMNASGRTIPCHALRMRPPPPKPAKDTIAPKEDGPASAPPSK
jgi:hypothetical protein